MTESSYYWSGTTLGDATLSPYDDDDFSDNWSLLHSYDRTVQGVIDTDDTAYSSKLACTNPAGTTIRIAKGAAMVDGKIYKNTADVDFAVVAPGAGTNYYLVVTRKTWATQVVRLAMLGPSAVATPTVTQTDGTLWEIPLWEVEITAAGAITITDVRVFSGSRVNTNNIANRTRTLFVPANVVHNDTDAVYIYPQINFITMPNNKDCYAHGYFMCPPDFVADMTVAAVAQIGPSSGDAYVSLACLYGAAGQNIFATHSSSTAVDVQACTANLIKVFTPMAVTDAAIGDYFWLQFQRKADDILDTINDLIYCLGFLISYTADM